MCALQELHPSHSGLEYNRIALISSYSFLPKVEAGTQRCKSNTNPLWAPILRIIKTKSAAAAAPHKTLGKHPERAANQPAGWGAIPAKNVPAGRRPHPCRWTGVGSQGSKSILKGWKLGCCVAQLQGRTRPAPSGNGALAKKSNRTKPIAPAGTGLRAPRKEWVGLGEFGRDDENEKGREKRRKWEGGGDGIRKRGENAGEGKRETERGEETVKRKSGEGGGGGRERKGKGERAGSPATPAGGRGQGAGPGSVPTCVGAGGPGGWEPGAGGSGREAGWAGSRGEGGDGDWEAGRSRRSAGAAGAATAGAAVAAAGPAAAGGPARGGRPCRGRAERWRLGRGPVPAPGDLFRPESGRPRHAAARRGARVAAAAAAATPAACGWPPGRSHGPPERRRPPGPRRPPCLRAAPALLPGERRTLLGSSPPRGAPGTRVGGLGPPPRGTGAVLLVFSALVAAPRARLAPGMGTRGADRTCRAALSLVSLLLPTRLIPDLGQVPLETRPDPTSPGSLATPRSFPTPPRTALQPPPCASWAFLTIFSPLLSFSCPTSRMPPAPTLLLVSARSSWPGPFSANALGDGPRVSSALQLLHDHSSQVADARKKSSSL